VQIANKGESDGNYDSVELSITSDPPPIGEPPSNPPALTPQTQTESSGCSLGAPPSGPEGALALGGLGLAVLVARRRRR